jgi:dolichol-phosphate mannosyltransferase
MIINRYAILEPIPFQHDQGSKLEEQSNGYYLNEKAETLYSLKSSGRIREISGRKLHKKPVVAIILATYCEAENIESLIREIESLGFNILITVIDDSSPDMTVNIVKRLQIDYENILICVRSAKFGLGTAITDGFRLILTLREQPDYVMTMDADYSHNPRDISRLINAAKYGNDLVIGSRYCDGGKTIEWNPSRRLISRVANMIASMVIGTSINDCTSGFRCYSIQYIRAVLKDLHSETYEIQIETIRQAKIKGFQVKEIPIFFMNRKKGKSKLTIKEFRTFFSYLIKNTFKGKLPL